MAETQPEAEQMHIDSTPFGAASHDLTGALPSESEPDEVGATAAANTLQKSLVDLGAQVFFEKTLTSSDASGSGRVVIPKAVAEQYFPALDNAAGIQVTAVDTFGSDHQLRFRFWINNQSRMYLLEGMADVMSKYRMRTGHVLVFALKPGGPMVLAGRPPTREDHTKRPPPRRLPTPSKPASAAKAERSASKAPDPSSGTKSPATRPTKRSKTSVPGPGWPADMEPPTDGIFRAVHNVLPTQPASGIAPSANGHWVATLTLAGEVYQAFFETQEDAIEAYSAAGFIYTPPPQPVGPPAATPVPA